MLQADKEEWIVKNFDGESTQTLENYYITNLDRGTTPTASLTNSTTMTNKYTSLLEKTQSTFSIQAFYKDEFAPTHYDLESDSFIVDDTTAFNSNLTNEFNSTTNTIQAKVLLAQLLNNTDLLITLKEDGVAQEELSDSDTLEGGKDNDYYHNLIDNNYKNLNKQDIMINIFKRIA